MFVPVASVQMRLESVEGESTFKLVNVAFEAVTLVKLPFVANAFVAVVFVKALFKAKRLSPVAFVNNKFVITPFVIAPFVATKFVAKRFVEVVFVPVAFVQTIEAVVALEMMTSPKLPFQRRDGVPRL